MKKKRGFLYKVCVENIDNKQSQIFNIATLISAKKRQGANLS